jgi:molecular chaperone DnaK (HSP70)
VDFPDSMLVSTSKIGVVALVLAVLSGCAGGPATSADSTATLRKPIGITTAGDVFTPLVPAGQRLPFTRSMTFGNATNGREEVMVELAQKDATGTETITSLRIPIPKAANKSLDITVTLIISADKKMKVKTTVAQTGDVKEFGPYPVT